MGITDAAEDGGGLNTRGAAPGFDVSAFQAVGIQVNIGLNF